MAIRKTEDLKILINCLSTYFLESNSKEYLYV